LPDAVMDETFYTTDMRFDEPIIALLLWCHLLLSQAICSCVRWSIFHVILVVKSYPFRKCDHETVRNLIEDK
ncbi:hypothetical protein DPMN_012262, partial [Dreissena polymorpha]